MLLVLDLVVDVNNNPMRNTRNVLLCENHSPLNIVFPSFLIIAVYMANFTVVILEKYVV